MLGTLNNCAGGQTPWGTYLTAEENVDYYFGNGAALARADASVQQAHRRLPPRSASIHGWEHVDARFDLGREPTELLRFGWIVEIDPYDPTAPAEEAHRARPLQARRGGHRDDTRRPARRLYGR